MTLADVPPGAAAIVTAVSDDAPPRVLEMGVLPGTRVEVVRLAPLGDPMEVRVRGYHLSLRLSEAAAVTVEPVAVPPESPR